MNREIIAGALLLAVAVALWLRRKAIQFRWPLLSVRITSGFGERTAPTEGASTFHTGVDLAAPEGTPVYAPGDGVVISIYTNDAGGKQLTIRHPNGFVSGYAHLSRYAVKVSDSVLSGQLIAYTGKTGNVTGPHLHFSLRDSTGTYVDPRSYLPPIA